MKPEAQRIAIAAAMGWKMENPTFPFYGYKRMAADDAPDWQLVPDYLNSLDAMHVAEGRLANASRRGTYHKFLTEIAIGDSQADQLCHATAAQRSEAFLKAIGKWSGQEEGA